MKNKKNIFWIFLILFYLVYSYFIFSKPQFIKRKNLIEIKGQLAEKPIFFESTGDNIPEINFKIIENSTKYVIKSCGLGNINKEKFLSLKIRDSVIFTIDNNSSFYDKIKNEKEVYSIYSNNNLQLLNLKDYNFCKKSIWKEFFTITILLLVTFLFSFLIERINK